MRAQLAGANLTGAILRNADLTSADLDTALLPDDAALAQALNLDKSFNLNQARALSYFTAITCAGMLRG